MSVTLCIIEGLKVLTKKTLTIGRTGQNLQILEEGGKFPDHLYAAAIISPCCFSKKKSVTNKKKIYLGNLKARSSRVAPRPQGAW
jgi:hypothetical protein